MDRHRPENQTVKRQLFQATPDEDRVLEQMVTIKEDKGPIGDRTYSESGSMNDTVSQFGGPPGKFSGLFEAICDSVFISSADPLKLQKLMDWSQSYPKLKSARCPADILMAQTNKLEWLDKFKTVTDMIFPKNLNLQILDPKTDGYFEEKLNTMIFKSEAQANKNTFVISVDNYDSKGNLMSRIVSPKPRSCKEFQLDNRNQFVVANCCDCPIRRQKSMWLALYSPTSSL